MTEECLKRMAEKIAINNSYNKYNNGYVCIEDIIEQIVKTNPHEFIEDGCIEYIKNYIKHNYNYKITTWD